MDVKRYVLVQAVKTKDNVLIPIWDENVILEKSQQYGNTLSLKNTWRSTINELCLVDAIYDIKTKTLNAGIELDFYPDEKKLEFKKGETVFYEKSHRILAISTIVDIIYEEYDLRIQKGKNIDKLYVNHFNNIKIEPSSLYAIKTWKPVYILEDGFKINWEHKLFHRSEN